MEYRISLPTKTCIIRLFVLSWQCGKEERENLQERQQEKEKEIEICTYTDAIVERMKKREVNHRAQQGINPNTS
jgi:hypothetical protein